MEFKVEIEGLERLKKASTELLVRAERELQKGLQASGLMIEKDTKQSIASGPKTGRVYRRRSVTHQASAPGEAPASDTGRLVNSINVRPVPGELAVDVAMGGGLVDYARSLEFGTRKMAARPSLQPAAEKNKPAIRARLNKAVDTAIKQTGT